MTTKKNIFAICGSTRKNSANLQILKAIEKLSENSFNFSYFDLTILPYFNQDITDEEVALEVQNFRNEISKADGVIICTPEYVFSLPGILKNAIEWTVSTTVFSDKPTALITASSSGENAHESLLLVMKTLGIKTTDEMCLLISGVKSKLNFDGEIVDRDLENNVKNLVFSFKK